MSTRESRSDSDLGRALREKLKELGIEIDPRRFIDFVSTFGSNSRDVSRIDQTSQLTASEADALRHGGFAPNADSSAYERVRAKTAGEFAALLAQALSTAEVAGRLGVDPSRVRQLLAARRLLATRDGSTWRILDIQFSGNGLVLNIEEVVSALPEDLPALVAASWLTSPEADLELGDKPVSPIEWLSAGGDPVRVTALAAEL